MTLPAEPATGRKDDSGKLRWSLMPWDAAQQIMDVLEFGARKYAENNWQRVPGARQRYFDAAMRHLIAWWQGERNDPESGLHHLAHCACCVLFLIWLDNKE